MIIKYLAIFLVLLLITSCTTTVDNANFKVEYKGALKNMMRKGDISAKADLSELKELKNIYALGAIENLKGEIQIYNGKPFNTFVVDNMLVFDNSFDKKATLLVYASIEKWKTESTADFRFCPKILQTISHSKQLGFGSDQLLEFCDSIIGLEEKLSPVVITPEKKEDYIHVIMPLKV